MSQSEFGEFDSSEADASSQEERVFTCRAGECEREFETKGGRSTHEGWSHSDDNFPWKDEDTLRKLYHDERLSQPEIATELGCTLSAVQRGMEANDIDPRSASEAESNKWTGAPVPLEVANGYVRWAHQYKGERDYVRVHRLLAVAEYGFDAVCEHAIHHGPIEVRWANWGENVQPMSFSDHGKHHAEEKPPTEPRF